MTLGYYSSSDHTSGESFALSTSASLRHDDVDGWMSGADDVDSWEPQ